MLTAFLTLLQGKKTTIFSILGLLNVTLLAEGLINNNWAYFIGSVIVVLGGSANYATAKLLPKA